MARLRGFFVVLLILMLLPTQARALSVAWSIPGNVSDSAQNAEQPQIAMSADGTKATAVWRRSDGANFIIQTSSATISGNTATWGPITNLSAAGADAEYPQVVLSEDGTKATAVWDRQGSPYRVQSASATIIGNVATWGAAVNVSNGQDGLRPQIAMSSDGTNATVVWRGFDGTNYISRSASGTISDTTSSWGSVTDLSAVGGNAYEQQVAISANDTRAVAIWVRRGSLPGSPSLIQISSATINGTTASWSAVTDLSDPTHDSYGPQIALSADATKATAVWFTAITKFTVQSVSATFSGGTATWGAVTNLTDGVQHGGDPQIGLSTDGTKATVVWRYRYDGTLDMVQARSAVIDGTAQAWGSTANLSAEGQSANSPQIALSTSGIKATAIWYRNNGANKIVQSMSAAISGNTATWGSVADLSDVGRDGQEQQIALSSDGTSAVGIWQRSDGSHTVVQTSVAGIEPPTPTPTITPTATPTPTATVTSTATLTPTATVAPTPTAAPSGPGNTIRGQIFDAQGNPAPGVVVYLFRTEAETASGRSASSREGVQTTLTSTTGEYLFENVSPGSYTVRPDMTTLSFYPPEISVTTEADAPPILAQPVDLHADGCESRNYAEAIVDCDAKAREQLQFVIDKAAYFTGIAEARSRGRTRTSLLKSLSKAEELARSVYSASLRRSLSIPKTALSCQQVRRCKRHLLNKSIHRYSQDLASLRRISFFLLRRTRTAVPKLNTGDAYRRQTLRLHQRSLHALRRLPASTYQCAP